MTEKKGWGSTVAGWFIQRDEDAGGSPGAEMSAEEAEALINEASGAASSPEAYANPSPTQNVFQTAPPPAAGGQVDFDAVFDAAGVDAEERGRVARTVELLRSLPAGTDATVKKQIVEASLNAFAGLDDLLDGHAERIQRGRRRRDT